MARNYYAETIRLFNQGNLDYREICCSIAEKHPKVFVQACEKIGVQATSPLELKLVELLRKKLKIQAIKEQRAATNMSLLDAKNYVEELERKWHLV